MSLQVGAFCFATQLDAASAACSSFPITYYAASGVIASTTCTGVNPDGSLILQEVTTDTSNNSSVVATISQLQSYAPCNQTDYLNAVEIVFSGVLFLWMVYYTGRKILSFVNWSRGDND